MKSRVSRITPKDKICWLIDEYKMLKEEETKLFSFQFTILSVWFAFVGTLLTVTVGKIGDMQAEAVPPTSNMVLFVLIVIALPCVSSFLGVLWLDMTCRFIKHAHYLWILENKIKRITKNEEIFQFEHYIVSESDKTPKFLRIIPLPVNYILYGMVLGLMICVPIMDVILQAICFWDADRTLFLSGCGVLFAIELVTVFFLARYVSEILRYRKEKDLFSKK